MKYTNQQKEIIRLIENGTIYDIPSFVTYTNQKKFVSINKSILAERFEKQVLVKRYYYPANLKIDQRNLMDEQEYNSKINLHQVNPNSYKSIDISLNNDAGIKTHVIGEQTIVLDLYKGIYIAESFNDIYEFLILWQHLKEEMLIQECSCDNYVDTLGLFYKSQYIRPVFLDTPESALIDFSSCSISDKYLLDQDFIFCSDAHFRCQDFIGKRIYPSIHLSLFVKNNFMTESEISQRRSMRVAWIAILVSILLAILPYVNDHLQPDPIFPIINDMQNTISTLEMRLEEICNQIELNNALHKDALMNDEIIEALRSIIEEISRLEEKLATNTDVAPKT